jgi:hypothetical protein
MYNDYINDYKIGKEQPYYDYKTLLKFIKNMKNSANFAGILLNDYD